VVFHFVWSAMKSISEKLKRRREAAGLQLAS
jgi:hypothetical protein